MTIRKRSLSEGWYPRDELSAAREINTCLDFASNIKAASGSKSVSVIAPHASWFYSGPLAVAAISSLRRDAATIIIFGGHLSDRARPLFAEEEAFDTPFGLISADSELRDYIKTRFTLQNDRSPDNTVEIMLPLVKHLFPSSRLVWLRMPASMEAFELGKALGTAVSEKKLKAVAIGSTDLTHYGPNYGFAPKGIGAEALRWVRETNDRRFIDAILSGDAERALSFALNEGSACSPGGAIAALGFALAQGATEASLLGYATSADVSPSSSFVGYSAISWAPK